MYYFMYCYSKDYKRGYALNKAIEDALETAREIVVTTNQWAHIMYNVESNSVYVVCEEDYVSMSLYERSKKIINVALEDVSYSVKYPQCPDKD